MRRQVEFTQRRLAEPAFGEPPTSLNYQFSCSADTINCTEAAVLHALANASVLANRWDRASVCRYPGWPVARCFRLRLSSKSLTTTVAQLELPDAENAIQDEIARRCALRCSLGLLPRNHRISRRPHEGLLLYPYVHGVSPILGYSFNLRTDTHSGGLFGVCGVL